MPVRTMGSWVRRMLRGGPSEAEAEASSRAVAAFRLRCLHFRLLLSANKSVLRVMSEMEEAQNGQTPFGMSWLRGHCVEASSGVYRIIRHLTELADADYTVLFDRYRAIQTLVQEAVRARHRDSRLPPVVPLSSVGLNQAEEVGGKMAVLGQAASAGIPVPPGFVVTMRGVGQFLAQPGLQDIISSEQQKAAKADLDTMFQASSAIRHAILQAPLPQTLSHAMDEAMDELVRVTRGQGELRLAVRSSALFEDSANFTGAGQYHTELGVTPDGLRDAFRLVVASMYGGSAMSYRLSRGIPDEDVAMCVGCLAMVDAMAGGVAYSRNPTDPADESVAVHAVSGLAKAVVDGVGDVDVFRFDRNDLTLVESRIVAKPQRYVRDEGGGVAAQDVPPDQAALPSLTDDLAAEVARLALRLEERFGCPQDVEWAVDRQSRVVLLQSRPLSLLEASVGEATSQEGALMAGGVAVSSGVGAGPACVVDKEAALLTFPKGGVLVVNQPVSRLAPLLSRAAAMVAERGSMAGHLATVCREFGVPAIFGLRGAVDALRHAGEITVDTRARAVFPGIRDDLAACETAPAANLLAGSPVFTALTEASRHIVPLNLLDPASDDFAPQNCRTYHDITRFCHEKAVAHMFAGSDTTFPQGSAKQLTLNGRKLQYWIIDLHDGFTEPIEGHTVRLDQIACEPFLKLWEGMVAKPWEGPPSVDARGFLSVVASAATNPDLEPSRQSSMSMRNSIMLSRHFCSMQARFGFHLCTVEAVVDETPEENYVGFQFKGGGADRNRQLRRARLVGETLEALGFTADVRGDALFAKLEGRGEEYSLKICTVVGYLLIHTRQVDMVMDNPDQVARIRAKFASEIAELMG